MKKKKIIKIDKSSLGTNIYRGREEDAIRNKNPLER
jgi:hypothetical protein